ncbi:MAG: ABC transporter permease [Thaumarchaeota archaeon]|nr:ABC transporter permease [Nitrososphaerota archaeon]
MRLSKSWIIASKDFKMFLKKKNIIYSAFVVPLLASIFLPIVIYYIEQQNGGSGIPPSELTYLLPALTFFYLILAGLIPTTIASYSIIGEKVEKSFERLLATPTTDSEILLGKGISSFLPPMGAILVGAAIYMVLMDVVTHGTLGYYFFPNWNAAVVFFLAVPLATVMSVEWNVIVSARVSDVRVAQQIGMLLVLPFAGVYIGGELGIVPLDNTSVLLIIAAILLVVDLLLLYVARATFRREEILTKWK